MADQRGMKGLNHRGAGKSLSNSAAALLNRCSGLVQRCLPASCVFCGAATRPECVCTGCDAALPRLPPQTCAVCALPLVAGVVCGACMTAPPAYDRVRAAYAYDFPIDAVIQAYKYGGRLALAPIFARALAAVANAGVDVIVPVPLGRLRLRERGFNQAHEIGRLLARLLGVPDLHACRRVADTAPQAALPWKERARNIRGAFVCDADLSGRRVAIVDDVMTTGATIDELSKKLKHAGATDVSAWVVARTLPGERPLAGAVKF